MFYPKDFFLKSGVTSANFRLCGNLPLLIASFTRFCKKLDETLWLSFNILEGMLFLVLAFFELMFLISFSTSVLLTAEKGNLYLLNILLWINSFVPNAPFLYLLKTSENVEKGCIGNKWVNKRLGWCLYLAIALWTGSHKL